MTLNDRLNECARHLYDDKLLARLSGGVTMALEFLKISILMPELRKSTTFSNQIAKPGIVKLAYIVETKTNTEGPVVYKLGSVVVDFLFIVTPIVGVCNCSMFCCALLCPF